MNWLRQIVFRLRAVLGKRQKDRVLDEELNTHLTLLIEQNIERGMSPEAARREAKLSLGGAEQIKESVHDHRGLPFLETFVQDLRYALRMLRKSPGFTAVAVLTLALGIGANTAIFTLLDGLILRDLSVSRPEQIVHLGAHPPGDDYASVSLPMFEEIARDQTVFSSMFAWWGDGVFNVEANGQLSHAGIWAVTGNFYSELGAVSEIGRLIVPADADLHAAAPAQIAVLGYGFWQRNFGGAKDIVGKTVKVEGIPFTIIGVTRKGFTAMDADSEPEVTVPLTAEPLIAGDADVQKHLQRRDALWLDAGARLKPGVTLAQASAQLDSLWPTIRQAMMPVQATPVERANFTALQMKVESYATGYSFLRGRFAKPVYVLLAISDVVLLLACVNLASLMLSRASARSHEFGVRVALGASRARLARQVLTESVMISVAGTLAGFVFATWGSRAFSDFILGEIYITPSALNLSPDLRILSFTAAVALVTGVLFGLAPAWRATREDPNSALQQSSRTVGRGTGRLGKGLIVTQVALSVVLVAGAGLFVRTLEKLRAVQPGFRMHGVLEVELFPLPNAFKNADRVAYFHELTDRISNLPGVISAGMEHMEIGGLLEWTEKIQVHGVTSTPYSSDCEMVMPGFFRTEDIALRRGRTFQWSDNAKAPHVAVISENLAERLFPNGDAIGQRIDIATEPKWQNLQVVGVVSNATLYNFRKPPQPTVYMPTTQYGDYMDNDEILIQTSIPPAATLSAVRSVLDSVGRESVLSTRPLSQAVQRSILQERMTAMLSAFFGALALLLAAIGLYGLMAYNVTRRTREMGIRFALGAQRSGILKMILRETLTLTLAGIVIGLPCALAVTRLVAHMLFGVTPYDPLTLTAVAIALLAVGALAGYIPARRAMKVDPMVALRYE
jgi:predicted permease